MPNNHTTICHTDPHPLAHNFDYFGPAMAGYSHFMRLPVELRLQIYAHAFHHFELADELQGITLHSNIRDSAHMLCRVNKCVRAEAVPALAEQTKVLIVNTKHLTAPSDAPYIASYRPRPKYDWFINIEVLAFGGAIKRLPELTRFPNLKAVVVLETVIWGVLQCALPIRSTILRLTKSDYRSAPSNWVRPLFLEPNRTFKIWARIVFVGLDEMTSDSESFTELLALRELLASSLWFEEIWACLDNDRIVAVPHDPDSARSDNLLSIKYIIDHCYEVCLPA